MRQLYGDDPMRTADHGTFNGEGTVCVPKLTDHEIIGELCDLFAGRQHLAYGETLEWWMDVCADLSAQDLASALLPGLSKWPFDHDAAAAGLHHLRTAFASRARLLIETSVRDTGEVPR